MDKQSQGESFKSSSVKWLICLIVCFILLGTIFYLINDLRAMNRRAELERTAMRIIPSSLEYSCRSQVTWHKPIRNCKELQTLLVKSKHSKYEYTITDDSKTKLKTFSPIMACILKNNVGDQYHFKAFKSFASRMSPVVCPLFKLSNEKKGKSSKQADKR